MEFLILGLVLLIIGLALTVYAFEKAETHIESDDIEKIEKAVKWGTYLRYAGEIAVVIGLIGLVSDLSRKNLFHARSRDD